MRGFTGSDTREIESTARTEFDRVVERDAWRCVRMTPRLFVILVVFVLVTLVGAACGDSTDSAPAAESEAAVEPGPVDDTEEAEALRQLAYAYWDAVKSLGYLEDDYRQQRDDTVRGEIQSVQLFGIRLEVSEHTPPHTNYG